MCIGIPMRVIEADARDLRVCAVGRNGERWVGTQLVGACVPGEWLLVFIDDARERLTEQRAAEIDSVLDLLGDALAGDPAAAGRDPGFALPSAQPLATLRALGSAAIEASDAADPTIERSAS